MANDSVEGRAHGPGRDAEGLQKVSPDAQRDDDGDKKDLDVFLESVGATVAGKCALTGLID